MNLNQQQMADIDHLKQEMEAEYHKMAFKLAEMEKSAIVANLRTNIAVERLRVKWEQTVFDLHSVYQNLLVQNKERQ